MRRKEDEGGIRRKDEEGGGRRRMGGRRREEVGGGRRRKEEEEGGGRRKHTNHSHKPHSHSPPPGGQTPDPKQGPFLDSFLVCLACHPTVHQRRQTQKSHCRKGPPDLQSWAHFWARNTATDVAPKA